MKTFTCIAIAATALWFVGEVDAQQPGNKAAQGQQQFGGQQGGQQGGKGRRGNRRGMGQGQGQGQQGQGRRGGGPQMMEFIFNRFDKDQNGSISLAEAPERMKGRFDQLDTDGDKAVSKEEMQAAFAKMGQGRQGQRGQGRGQGKGKGKGKNGAGGKQQGKGKGKEGAGGKGQRGQRGQMPDPTVLITKMDKNNDGSISIEEAPEKMKQRFDRLDADSNGSITADELKAAFGKMKKGKNGKGQIGRNKSANPEDKLPVKPKRPPMAEKGA